MHRKQQAATKLSIGTAYHVMQHACIRYGTRSRTPRTVLPCATDTVSYDDPQKYFQEVT